MGYNCVMEEVPERVPQNSFTTPGAPSTTLASGSGQDVREVGEE